MDTNSREYWNFRFKSGSWLQYDGKNQSTFFMKLLITNLPDKILADISINCKQTVDFGTALGQGCFELSQSFPNLQITGYDISEEAINQAKELYRDYNIQFTSTPLQVGIDKFDVIFCSNTLEHLLDWEKYLDLFTKISQKYIIILIPYESEIFDEHVVSFNENSFPNTIGEFNKFIKIFEKIIDTHYSGFWNGEQQLLVYKKEVIN